MEYHPRAIPQLKIASHSHGSPSSDGAEFPFPIAAMTGHCGHLRLAIYRGYVEADFNVPGKQSQISFNIQHTLIFKDMRQI